VAVGLLQFILLSVATLFGLVPDAAQDPITLVVGLAAPIVGTMYYIDWRWSWKGEHIGLSRNPGASALTWLLGLAGGAVAAFLAHIVSELLKTGTFTFVAPAFDASVNPMLLAEALLPLFVVELVYRGAAISRLQADLSPREVLIGAPLLPVLGFLISALFERGELPLGIATRSDLAATVFLALLFLRTDSVWLSAGLRMGFMAAISLLSLPVTDQGGLVVWGVGALVLLAMELAKLQRMPKKVTQRGRTTGRTTRGPWGGPH
jgi:hypothetical protein